MTGFLSAQNSPVGVMADSNFNGNRDAVHAINRNGLIDLGGGQSGHSVAPEPNMWLTANNQTTGAITFGAPKGKDADKSRKYRVVILQKYLVKSEACTKCGICFKKCPEDAITWEKGEIAEIIQEKCIKCGICYDVCKFEAVGLD